MHAPPPSNHPIPLLITSLLPYTGLPIPHLPIIPPQSNCSLPLHLSPLLPLQQQAASSQSAFLALSPHALISLSSTGLMCNDLFPILPSSASPSDLYIYRRQIVSTGSHFEPILRRTFGYTFRHLLSSFHDFETQTPLIHPTTYTLHCSALRFQIDLVGKKGVQVSTVAAG